MKSLLNFIVKEFGFLFEDYPLESGILLIVISIIGIYLLRNRIFYVKNESSILQYIINLKTIAYGLSFIGLSQLLRGLNIYDSILKNLSNGLEVFGEQYPLVAGGLIVVAGIYLIYDKLNNVENDDKDNLNEYKFWAFTAILIIIGASIIFNNI